MEDPFGCKQDAGDVPFSIAKNSIVGQSISDRLPFAEVFTKKRKRELASDCTRVQPEKNFQTPFSTNCQAEYVGSNLLIWFSLRFSVGQVAYVQKCAS